MDDNERQKYKGAKSFRSVKEILEFVDDFVAGKHKVNHGDEKAFDEIRQYVFEGIKYKRDNPNSELYQTAKVLLDLFDRIESEPAVITMYQRKKLETDLKIFEQLLTGERERHSEKLSGLENPVACVVVGNIVHKYSYNIARRLRAGKYPVVREGNKCYCDAEHAALIWPKWKKYWKKQKLEE